MNVLVLGAGGFIGSHLAAAMSARGHRVVGGVRAARSLTRSGGFAHGMAGAVACDLSLDHDPARWAERLRGFDAVVNAVGILRPRRGQGFTAVHVDGPRALWSGCELAGVARVIQISALGDPAETEFIRSKHLGDRLLEESGLDFTVLRPALVHSPHASYGGTALLRALACLPGALLVPGDGRQRLQPVTLEDLVAAVIRCLEQRLAVRQVIELVGPRETSLIDYLAAYRGWLGRRGRRIVRVPLALARAGAWLGERIGVGPLGSTMMRMLEQGHVGAAGAMEDTRALLGRSSQSVEESLAANPADTADRWHAALYPLRPLLRVALALLWIGSGLVGLTAPTEATASWVAALGLGPSDGSTLALAAGGVNLLLGAMLLLGIAVRWALALMLISVLAYTVTLGWAMPALWLEPAGGLLKNLPLIPALLIMVVLEPKR